MAIRMKVKKATEEHDPSCSKFFGAPTFPEALLEGYPEEVIFLCQIRLSDIAKLDKENALPHEGYLYLFLDVESGFPADVFTVYTKEEPTHIIDDFNEVMTGYEHLNQDWVIEFEEVEDEAEGHKLLGVPADWFYQDPPPKLLMQFDPLEADMGLFTDYDGFIYFFFGDDINNFDAVNMFIDRS